MNWRGCRNRTLTEMGLRALRPFTRGDVERGHVEAVVVEALNLPIPLVHVEPDVYALICQVPTLAFKDVGARVMARLMATLHEGDEPLTMLVATSGDTGSAVAHAFRRVPAHAGRDSLSRRPRQPHPGSAADDVQRSSWRREGVTPWPAASTTVIVLTRQAFGDTALRRRMRLTSANSVNVGPAVAADGLLLPRRRTASLPRSGTELLRSSSHPERQLGSLTAGLIPQRSGLPLERFIAATNANDIVPAYLATGPSSRAHRSDDFGTRWTSATRATSSACRGSTRATATRCAATSTAAVTATMMFGRRSGRVFQTRGYLLDPHSAMAYLGLKRQAGQLGQVARAGQVGVFLQPRIQPNSRRSSSQSSGRRWRSRHRRRRRARARGTSFRIDASLDAVEGRWVGEPGPVPLPGRCARAS